MADTQTPPASATAVVEAKEELYTQPDPPNLPPGHGRIDCSCGSLIHWCGCDNQDPSHYQAVLTLHHSCPSCISVFGDTSAEEAGKQAQASVPTMNAADAVNHGETVTLEVVHQADAGAQAVAAADDQVIPTEA